MQLPSYDDDPRSPTGHALRNNDQPVAFFSARITSCSTLANGSIVSRLLSLAPRQPRLVKGYNLSTARRDVAPHGLSINCFFSSLCLSSSLYSSREWVKNIWPIVQAVFFFVRVLACVSVQKKTKTRAYKLQKCRNFRSAALSMMPSLLFFPLVFSLSLSLSRPYFEEIRRVCLAYYTATEKYGPTRRKKGFSRKCGRWDIREQ